MNEVILSELKDILSELDNIIREKEKEYKQLSRSDAHFFLTDPTFFAEMTRFNYFKGKVQRLSDIINAMDNCNQIPISDIAKVINDIADDVMQLNLENTIIPQSVDNLLEYFPENTYQVNSQLTIIC